VADSASVAKVVDFTLARIRDRLPGALDRIRDRCDQADGYPTSTPGAEPSSSRSRVDPEGMVVLTSVEAAADLRRRSERDEEIVLEQLVIAAHALAKVDRIVMRWNPPAEQVVCNRGVGREGQASWGKKRCEELAADDRGGMCFGCAKREYRWRQRMGLPPRPPRTAPAQNAEVGS
jgi:hypothetical protein